MTRKTLIEYCLTFPNVYEDYPFNDGDTEKCIPRLIKELFDKVATTLGVEKAKLTEDLK
ncbi:MAG: hypothetical protein FWG63_07100 [Defluviitaleaceae bacterium]|nr:hypothetical protein [Defluviitaleaceae bacterium]